MQGPFQGGWMHGYIYLCGCKTGIKGMVVGIPGASRTPAGDFRILHCQLLKTLDLAE